MDSEKVQQYEAVLRKALKEMEGLRAQVAAQSEPIAVIGMSCRFPGACNTPAEYWDLVASNRDGISDIPSDRWNINEYYDVDPEAPGKMHVRKGGFISQKVDGFDAKFFGVSPTEAIELDPQQRILLELAWEAFENAGYDPTSLRGTKAGTFIGIAIADYALLLDDKRKQDLRKFNAYSITGYVNSIAVGRLAHFFGLQGPALALDTACSSSLVAAHLACESIRNGDCEIALAGGITLNLFPGPFIGLCRMRALAADGHCKTFEADADGYGRSEGGGIIVLKRLSAAVRDKDPILAVIKGSAVNQDGQSSGLTVPNGLAQEALIRRALESAGLAANDISYIETHGTGTPLGDPIELGSIANVMGKDRSGNNPLFLGAVKKNIGHTECAAGVAGLIKVILALQKQKIPPLSVRKLNPRINFGKLAVSMPDKLSDWTGPRHAGVSAFGFGGTNAHLIVSEAPPSAPLKEPAEGSFQLITLSALSPEALQALVADYCIFLSKTDASLANIAYSTNTGRAHFAHRIAIVANSKASLIEQLQAGSKPSGDLKLDALAQRYLQDQAINWRDSYPHDQYKKVILPNYPFQRKSFWIETARRPTTVDDAAALQGLAIPSSSNESVFIFRINLQNLPEVLDVSRSVHIGFSQEMLLNALSHLERVESYAVTDMTFVLPLLIGFEGTRTVALTLVKEAEGCYQFKFQSCLKDSDRWSLHIHGKISIRGLSEPVPQFDELRKQAPTFDTTSFYKMLDARTMYLGPSVRLVDKVWVQDHRLFANFYLRAPGTHARKTSIPLDPAVLDTCAQVFHAVLPVEGLKMMVSKIGELHINCQVVPNELNCSFRMVQGVTNSPNTFTGEFALHNEKGECIVRCRDFQMKGMSDEALKSLEEAIGEESAEHSVVALALTQTTVTAALLEEVARLLSMAEAEIDPSEALINLGMDSMMAVSLRNVIKRRLGVGVPLEEIVVGPSIEQLTAGILKLAPADTTPSLWFTGKRSPKAKFRLFCLPYGGGGAFTYRQWQDLLPNTIDVCPIQLPGRENRIKEAPFTDMDQLIQALAGAIEPMLDLPFAIFGHSYGGLVAFVLAKHLSEKMKRVPLHVFASAFTSPTLPNTRLAQIKSRLVDPMETEADMRLVFPESSAIPPELLPLYAKIGMADIKAVQSYIHEEYQLACDLTVFYGTSDETVPKQDMEAWKSLTRKAFSIHGIEGNHLFINDDGARRQMLKIIESLEDKL